MFSGCVERSTRVLQDQEGDTVTSSPAGNKLPIHTLPGWAAEQGDPVIRWKFTVLTASLAEDVAVLAQNDAEALGTVNAVEGAGWDYLEVGVWNRFIGFRVNAVGFSTALFLDFHQSGILQLPQGVDRFLPPAVE